MIYEKRPPSSPYMSEQIEEICREDHLSGCTKFVFVADHLVFLHGVLSLNSLYTLTQ